MSASPVNKDVTPLTHQRHLAVRQAEILNCPSDNSSIILACLMTKPWRELGDSLTKFWVRFTKTTLIVDGERILIPTSFLCRKKLYEGDFFIIIFNWYCSTHS